MYRFMSLYVFFSLVVPFAIVGIPTYLLETWVVLQILLSFYLGGYVARKVGPSCAVVNYQQFLVPSRSTVAIVFTIFLALRHRHLLDFIRELLNGDVAAWMLANAVARYDGSLTVTIFDQFGTIVFFHSLH